MQLTYINNVTWNLWLAYHTKKSHLYFFIIIAEGTKALKTPTEDPEVESFIKVQIYKHRSRYIYQQTIMFESNKKTLGIVKINFVI